MERVFLFGVTLTSLSQIFKAVSKQFIYAIYLSLYFSIKFKKNTALIPLNSILNDALNFRVKTQTLKPRVNQEHLLIGVLWNTCFKNFVSFPGKGQCWRPYMYLPF